MDEKSTHTGDIYIMKVFIGLAGPKKGFVPMAWAIQAILKRKYDHCYIRFQEPDGEWMIFQASGFAVNMYNADIWSSVNESLKEYEIETDKDVWGFVKARLGVPYSLKEDFGILLMKIFRLKKNPYSAGGSAEICSQLAADFCKFLGIDIPEDTSTIDPSRMDQILSDKGFKFTLNPKISSAG